MAGYIVPSKLYGILAAGRPYVAAVEEESEAVNIARKYDCGVVSRPSDPFDLAEKILRLYHDKNKLRTMGQNARKAALQFDRTAGIQAYYKMFWELLRTTASPASQMRATSASRAQGIPDEAISK
jgi:colanic acid biosynthesis glycosyl transferase WcaI